MLNKQLGLAIGTAIVIAAASIAPVSATDIPLTKSGPGAAAVAPAARTAPAVAVERRVVRRTVVRRAAPAPFVRVATVERRTSDCSLFFCWRNYPLILGVGF